MRRRLSFPLPFYHSDKHLFSQNQEVFQDRKRALCSVKSRALDYETDSRA